jgi:hypothetical protein
MPRPRKIPERGDVGPKVAAGAVGLSLNDFQISLDALLARGFPPADPTTGNYSAEAISSWRKARDAAAPSPLTPGSWMPQAGGSHVEAEALGKIKIPYYVVGKYNRGYWRPTKTMKSLGFPEVRCGPDGPIAWGIAAEWNVKWQAVRRGEAPPPIDAGKHKRAIAEVARVYPAGSIGAAFQVFLKTDEWKTKPMSTRNKVWWPAWYRIRDKWGEANPNSIRFDQMSAWRAELERVHGLGVAHKTLKIWRAFWKIMLGMKFSHGADPTTGIRNRKPRARHSTWQRVEAGKLAKSAWREDYRGLTCVITVAWDTLFSPADVRTLRVRHLKIRKDETGADRLWLDRSIDGRTKSGRPALGTLSWGTERILRRYLTSRFGDTTPLPDTMLFLSRTGRTYTEDSLSKEFADIREIEFPGETRKLMDIRRTGTVEAIAGSEGDGFALKLSAKLANSIDKSNELHRTYAPANLAPVLEVDKARRRGRRNMRESGG